MAYKNWVEDEMEYGWLIENKNVVAEIRTYFFGWDDLFNPLFIRDNAKAVRFCREEDAEKILVAMDDEFLIVSEHIWGIK